MLDSATDSSSVPGQPTIEKAVLLDVCLGVPLGRIWFSLPAATVGEDLPQAPPTALFRGEQLALMKACYRRGQQEMVSVVEALVAAAEQVRDAGPFSVTDKLPAHPQTDPHDYHSLAKYWWPDQSAPEGLPYVNRDGEVNPEVYSDRYDYVRLVRFSETVVTLALVAYLTEDDRYATRAAQLLRVWFVDEASRQNPHFRYAQEVPGRDKPRWQGLIEARLLIYVTEAIRLLEAVNRLDAETGRSLREWYAQLLGWMRQSEQGTLAREAPNNIGFWYDLQCLVYADFCGQFDLVDQIARECVAPRLDQQLAADGSLPAEMGRAYPHDYVAFTLGAMALISRLGDKHGLSLWNQETGDGRSFHAAHDWLLKAATTKELIPALNAQASEPGAVGLQASGDRLMRMLDHGLMVRGVQRLAQRHKEGRQRLQVEVDRLRAAHASEKAYLQAQIDAGNAMWDHFRRQSDKLQEKNKRLQKESERAKKELERAKQAHRRDQQELGAYARALEKRLKKVLGSRAWRIGAPLRVVGRFLTGLVRGQRVAYPSLPKRPVALGGQKAAATPKSASGKG